jgi:hypothetical protein
MQIGMRPYAVPVDNQSFFFVLFVYFVVLFATPMLIAHNDWRYGGGKKGRLSLTEASC